MQNQLWFHATLVAIFIGLYGWYHSITNHALQPDFVARTTANLKLPYMEFGGKLEQSPGDLREHKLIKLHNNLVVLCAKDVDTTQAAASLSIDIGGLADPPKLNGLAHFLEHMLFMASTTRGYCCIVGTEKYPDEGEYIAFIKKNAGQYNAFTTLHSTTYFFGITNQALEETLDRFSRFFIDPLFAPSSVTRELHAVDSEHKGNLQSDLRRYFQLQRALSNTSHPYSHFNTGNMETLRDSSQQWGLDIRNEMIRFYETYYSTDIMKLAVVGNHSMEQLVEWSVAKFSDIKSKGNTKPQVIGQPLTSDVMGKVVHYQTLGNIYPLILQFGLPELKAQYKTRPDLYLELLFERRTPGSLFHYLKQNGWATDIYTYTLYQDMDGFNMFEIGVDMTPDGLKHYSNIIRAVFEYLRVLVAYGPQQLFYDEISAVKELNFRFYKTPGVVNWVLDRSQRCHNPHIVTEHYLSAGNGVLDFSYEDVADFMAHLHPQNYRVFLGAQNHSDVEFTTTEKYFGTPYHVDSLPLNLTDETMMDWTEQYRFHLPTPNPFIPKSTKVVGKVVPPAEVTLSPSLLYHTDAYELWFKQDDQFARPYGYIRVQIAYAQTAPSSFDRAAAQLLDKYVAIILDEELDNAKVAGMKYSVSFLVTKVDIEVTGFSAKLPSLVDAILHRLKTLNIEDHIFQDSLTQMRQKYQNKRNEQPFKQLQLIELPHFNLAYVWSFEILEQHLANVTIDSLQNLATSAFERTYAKIIVSGNFYESDAVDTARNVQRILDSQPLSVAKQVHGRVVAIEPGHYIHRTQMSDASSPNGASLVTIYCGSKLSAKDRVITELLAHINGSPFFNMLRTKEQLGYVVYASKTSYETGRMMLVFNAQSEVNPAYLTQRTDKFIRDIRQHIHDYSIEEFDALVQSQIALKTAKLKSIEDEATRFWERISSGVYDFDYLVQEIAQLKLLTKGDLLEAWDMYVNPDTAVDYTRIDSQIWSVKSVYPQDSELSTYPNSVISLFGCLHSNGLVEVGIAELYEFVQHAALSNNVNASLSGLAELYSSKHVTEQTLERITTDDSRISAAVEMALQDIARSTHTSRNLAGDFSTKNMRQTLDGKWIIDNIDSFKAMQKLYDLAEPETSLTPKYTN
ncbi:metalloprotease [Coemansia sp. RSA 1853]|nr:metalloprotease [Coemansia sp. RSA 1853]